MKKSCNKPWKMLFLAAVLSAVCVPAVTFAAAYAIPDVVTVPLEGAISPPQDARVIETTPRSMTITWGSDVRTIFSQPLAADLLGPVPYTFYTIEVFEKKDGTLIRTIETDTNIVTINALEVNRGYDIRISAQRYAETAELAVLSARTIPTAPRLQRGVTVGIADVPRDVITNEPLFGFHELAAGKYEAQLHWKKATGKIRYYTLRVYEHEQDEPAITMTVKKPRAIVKGLKSGRYAYDITAHFNDEYASEPSARRKFVVEAPAL